MLVSVSTDVSCNRLRIVKSLKAVCTSAVSVSMNHEIMNAHKNSKRERISFVSVH